MRQVLAVTVLAMNALPRRRQLLPLTTRAAAGAVMAWLDRRRLKIDAG